MATNRNVTTGSGKGSYYKVRSKILKGKDGYGRVVTQEREKLLEKFGKDPGPDVVAMHKSFGAHPSKKIDPWRVGTRAENTAESNVHRKKLSDKIKDRGCNTKKTKNG